MAKCECPDATGTQELGLKRLLVRDWGLPVMLVCWELADLQSGLVVGALGVSGWSEGPQPGCAAGAESVGSAADELSSQRTSAAPYGRTDGRPATAVAGTPAANAYMSNYLKNKNKQSTL